MLLSLDIEYLSNVIDNSIVSVQVNLKNPSKFYCKNASSVAIFKRYIIALFMNTSEEVPNIYTNFIERFLISFPVMTKTPWQLRPRKKNWKITNC